MRTWLKRLAAVATCLLAGVILAGAVFLARPELMLTSATAGALLKRFGSAYSPRWSSLGFTAEAFETRRHRYIITAGDFCVDARSGVFSACFSRLELSAVIYYSRRGLVIERIERVVAVADGAKLDLRRREPPGRARALPISLSAISVTALRVALPRFSVFTATNAVRGDFRAELSPGVRRPLTVALDALVRSPTGARRLKADFQADTDLFKGGEPTYVDFTGRAELRSRGRARAAFRLRRNAGRYAGSGGVDIDASTGPLRAFRLSACEGSATPASGLELMCRFEAVAAKPALSLKAIKGAVSLRARRQSEAYQAELKARPDPIASWFDLSGELAVGVRGRFDRPLKTAALSHELHAVAKAARFSDLVAFLRETKYAVPAPVHVLEGPLSLELMSRGDPRAPRVSARYVFASDLAGPRQRLILRATGDVAVVNARTPGRSFVHDGKLILKEVALELPRLEIGRPPKVFVDPRITSGQEPLVPSGIKAPARTAVVFPPLRVALAVKTEKPLLLFSNLAKDPIPVALDMAVAFPPSAVSGLVAIRSFDVELFRRNATVDHLNVTLSSGSKVGALDGLVRYKTPAATIDIMLLGTTKKPRIELSSVPPLKREEIIGILIFGKSPAELDSEQSESVANTEIALESRAFGLASLYLFGATPIEHVAYDPATKETSVKLRLPGGANLTLGSDFEQSRQLSVRKPLAPHWVLASEITSQNQQTTGQSSSAASFLEWFNRY